MSEGIGAAQAAMTVAGIRQKIETLEQEAARLQDQLFNFERHYTTPEGKHDAARFKKDELRLGQLDRELRGLERKLKDTEQASGRWRDTANRRAADYLKGRLINVEEGMKEQVRNEFVESFKALVSHGTFERPEAQNEEQIDALIRDRFANALGKAYEQRLTSNKPEPGQAPPRDQGLDQQNEPPAPEPEDDGFGDDDFARDLFKSYVPPRERKARTLADVQRERNQAMRERDARQYPNQAMEEND